MSLQDELKSFKDQVIAGLPHETINIMVQATKNQSDSGIENRALAKGETLPPFSLPNIHGQTVSSADLFSKGPLVINFYRGSW